MISLLLTLLREFFFSFLRLFRILAVMLLTLIITFIAIPIAMILVGYRVNADSGSVAQLAAERGDVSLCRSIINYGLFIPTSGEARAHCIHRYASLAKDPSACELLMPSSYGLSCVGGAESQPDLCSMHSDKVSWKGGEETYKNCSKNHVKKSKEATACCHIARIAFVLSENDCMPLKEMPEYFDECMSSLAFKNSDQSICSEISHPNTKAACIVRAKGMEQNPGICSGCKQRVPTLDQFQ